MKLLRPLLLFSVVLLVLMPRLSNAQDYVTVKTDPGGGGVACWDITVHNNNQPGHLPINRVLFKITTPSAVFQDDPFGPENWMTTKGPDSILYVSQGASITYPASLAGFDFCLDNPPYDQEVTIQWTTMSNTSVVSTGTFTIIPLTFQTLAVLDTSWATATVTNGDPCFNFSVKNRNSINVGIDAMSFELQGVASGTIRPSTVSAPAGWVFDSASINTVYFHSIVGSSIEPNDVVSNFKACLRSNSTQFSWVWRASHEGFLIDRDTIRNLTVSGTLTPVASFDTMTAARTTGCLYNFTFKNYHTTNLVPPSKVDKITLTSLTTGVKFLAATTTPPNWGKAVNTGGDVLTFQAATNADAIASGQVSPYFAANIDNPTSGDFQLKWTAYLGSTRIDSGIFILNCSAAPPASDTATITGSGAECGFKVSLTNRHSPPSNIASISLTLSGSNKFASGTPAVVPNTWSGLRISDQSLKFQSSSSTDYLSTNSVADMIFSLEPTLSGPATITWQTFDANNTKISQGTLTASCALKSEDKITLTPDNSGSCHYALTIENRRGNGSSVTTVQIIPTGGWKVDTLGAPVPWTVNIASDGSATLSNSIGIPDFTTQQGFIVGFKGVGTQPDFQAIFNTTNNDQQTLSDTVNLTCSPSSGGGVVNGHEVMLDLSIAPNPMRESATITYSNSVAEYVTITMIDIMGHTRSTIVKEFTAEGEHTALIGTGGLPAGTYYLRMETPSTKITRKLVIE